MIPILRFGGCTVLRSFGWIAGPRGLLSVVVSLVLMGQGHVLSQNEGATVLMAPDGAGDTLLTDANGWTLYAWAGDLRGVSRCYDACAEAWPPALTDGNIAPPDGMPGTLGAIDRGDGTWQLTLEGWPLYLFAGDVGPGASNGDRVTDFGAEWHVVLLGLPSPPSTAADGSAR
jgi:predicted lipoprotein with Yx(FWY)xxD motif